MIPLRSPRHLRTTVRTIALASVVALATLTTPSRARAQKALVYCPIGIDVTGCTNLVAALQPVFPSGVDRGYDGSSGTVDLRSANLWGYSLIAIPSLATSGGATPYAVLSDTAMGSRLHDAILGRVALWSGTPDLGSPNGTQKDTLIQNLGKWAGANYGTVKGPGLVVFQDMSDSIATQYGWLHVIVGASIQGDSTVSTHATVQALTPTGTALLRDPTGNAIAFANMAAFGFLTPASSSGFTVDGAAVSATGTQNVLLTSLGGNTGGATITTDADDYAPGTIVTITGAGFAPGETVTIRLRERPYLDTPAAIRVVADKAGGFVDKSFSPDLEDVGVRFIASATGASSGVRTVTTFTDALSTSTSLTSSMNPSSAGQSVTFTATVFVSGGSVTKGTVNFFKDVSNCNGNSSSSGFLGSASIGAGGSASIDVSLAASAVIRACYTDAAGSNTYNSSNVTLSQTVGAVKATATVTLGGLSQTYSGSPLSATATTSPAGLTVTYTYNGSAQPPTNAGSFAVVATVNDVSYQGSASGTLVISPANQGAVIVTNVPTAPQPYQGAFTVGASGGSGTGAYSFSATGVCTVSTSGTVLMTSGTGTCVLSASRAGDANFNPSAPSASSSVTAALAPQAPLSISGAPTAPQTFGTQFTVQASGGSGTGAVSFTASGGCSISATTGVATMTSGTTACAVTASKAADADYSTVTSAAANVAAAKAAQTISWVAPQPITYGSNLSGVLNASISTGDGTLSYDHAASEVPTPGTLTITATAAATANYGLATQAINLKIDPKQLTGSFTAANKTYDGTTTAAFSSGALAGIVGTDAVALSGGTANFDTKNVGTGKTVTLVGATLSGAAAANYTLGSVATTTADITAKSTTASFTTASKTYDGSVTAAVLTRTIGGAVAGDVVSLAGGTAAFGDKNVGTAKTVTLTGASLAGTDGGNYSLASVNTTTADITPAAVTGSFTASNKVYDGNTTATVTHLVLSGPLGTDNVILTGGTAAFASKAAGTGKLVTLSGATLSGTDAANYSLGPVATTTADITPLGITGSITAADKTYDGTTSAVVTTHLSGTLSGDDVSLNATAGAFADPHVGPGKTVTANLSLSGNDAIDYTVNGSATATAAITPATVSGAFKVQDKEYDGTTVATIESASLTAGVFGSDKLQLTGGSATFSDANVGPNKTVTATGFTLSGASAGDYVLGVVAATTATITAKQLTGSITVADKPYDGNASATVLTRNLSGIVGADAVSLTGGTATFADKNAGPAKTVTLAGATLSGSSAGNYSLASVSTASAAITQLAIGGMFTASDKVYDGNTAAAVLTRQPTGAIAGDDIALAGGTATFDTKNAGQAKTITLAGASLSGADAPNYTLGMVATATAAITAKPVVGTITAASRTYDGTTNAAISGRSVQGVVPNDVADYVGGTAAFLTKTVGAGKVVNASGLSLSGTDAANYTVNSTASTTADITARTLVVSVTADNKVYDGTVAAAVHLADDRVAGDVFSIANTGAVFADKNVGAGIQVSVSGISISGADAGNYTANSSASTYASITQRALTLVTNNASKNYGLADPSPLTTGTVTGLVDGEGVTLTFSRLSGEDVGVYAISAVPTASAGTLLTNYSLTNAGATFTILQWWTPKGFYQPVEMTPLGAQTVWNAVKGGSTIPLKFQVFAGSTEITDVAQISGFTLRQVACTAGQDVTADADVAATGGTQLRYDATAHQFIYNWQAPKGAGTCYTMTMKTKDTSTLIGSFKTK